MANVSIRDSGIPRLYRTVWLTSEVGPDSGTLALSGLGQAADSESVGYLEAWVLLKATGDISAPLDRAVFWWDADLVNAFNRWVSRKAFGGVSLDPDVGVSEPEAPNPDFMLVSPSRVFYALIDDAFLPENEARLKAAMNEAGLDTVEFEGALRSRRPEVPPTKEPSPWGWGAAIVGGIGILGIWSLWGGRKKRRI